MNKTEHNERIERNGETWITWRKDWLTVFGKVNWGVINVATGQGFGGWSGDHNEAQHEIETAIDAAPHAARNGGGDA